MSASAVRSSGVTRRAYGAGPAGRTGWGKSSGSTGSGAGAAKARRQKSAVFAGAAETGSAAPGVFPESEADAEKPSLPEPLFPKPLLPDTAARASPSRCGTAQRSRDRSHSKVSIALLDSPTSGRTAWTGVAEPPATTGFEGGMDSEVILT